MTLTHLILLWRTTMNSTTGFLLKGLTEQHKQFLSQYAQEKLGSTSRTKAILALIEQQMTIENSKQEKNKKEAKMNELQKQAIEERKTYIEHHQQLIKQRHKDIQKAIHEQNHEQAKKLSQSRIAVEKKRIQFSLPIYDYQYLEKLATIHNSSIQYYITALIYTMIYSERKLLGSEIEALKISNYELYKIGVNINQIAKANNTGQQIELPINQLRHFIQNHVKIVQDILLKNTSIYS